MTYPRKGTNKKKLEAPNPSTHSPSFDSHEALLLHENAGDARLKLWQQRFENIRSKKTRDTLMDLAMEAAVSVCASDFATMQLVQPGGNLKLVANHGFDTPFLDYFDIVNDDTTSCGAALEKRSAVVVSDVAESPIFNTHAPTLKMMLDSGVRACTSTPLLAANGRMLGMISVHYRNPRESSHGDVSRFDALAESIAELLASRLASKRAARKAQEN